MRAQPRLSLVPKTVPASQCTTPDDPTIYDETRRRLGPLKPDRPAAAVRKSLRAALACSASMASDVYAVDARWPHRALPAAVRLKAHAQRIAALADELETAARREINGRRWLQGLPPYVE